MRVLSCICIVWIIIPANSRLFHFGLALIRADARFIPYSDLVRILFPVPAYSCLFTTGLDILGAPSEGEAGPLYSPIFIFLRFLPLFSIFHVYSGWSSLILFYRRFRRVLGDSWLYCLRFGLFRFVPFLFISVFLLAPPVCSDCADWILTDSPLRDGSDRALPAPFYSLLVILDSCFVLFVRIYIQGYRIGMVCFVRVWLLFTALVGLFR